jgi:hypothetical protein
MNRRPEPAEESEEAPAEARTPAVAAASGGPFSRLQRSISLIPRRGEPAGAAAHAALGNDLDVPTFLRKQAD